MTDTSGMQRFFVDALGGALELGLAVPEDVIKHVTPDVLASHLPRALWGKLLGACLAAPRVDARLIVDTIGLADLAANMPGAILWSVVTDVAVRALGKGLVSAPPPAVVTTVAVDGKPKDDKPKDDKPKDDKKAVADEKPKAVVVEDKDKDKDKDDKKAVVVEDKPKPAHVVEDRPRSVTGAWGAPEKAAASIPEKFPENKTPSPFGKPPVTRPATSPGVPAPVQTSSPRATTVTTTTTNAAPAPLAPSGLPQAMVVDIDFEDDEPEPLDAPPVSPHRATTVAGPAAASRSSSSAGNGATARTSGAGASSRRPQASATPRTTPRTTPPSPRRGGVAASSDFDLDTDVGTGSKVAEEVPVDDDQLIDWAASEETVTSGVDPDRKRVIADRMVEAAQLLRDAEKPVRILRTIAWEPEVRERFFAAGEAELPEPSYQALDPTESFEKINAARQLLDGDDPISELMRRTAWAIELGARMLAAVGTPDFHRYSTLLYGEPSSQLPDQASSALDLARTFESTLDAALHVALAPVETRTADEVAEQVGRAVVRHFGDAAPSVEVVEHLSANALAGTNRIRLRRGAAFTDRDAAQLIQHEAYVHIATSIAGRGQPLSILACGHPGTTRTQEGLAVFAELISGAIDPDRLRRLADRVLAIQMAQDGADFLDVYRWYVEQTAGDREQAFENARRVFRGGVLRGRAPFTKDVVYLDGLLRVHNFLRSAVMSGRADCIRLLFAGKLDIEDVPALCHLAAQGSLAPAPYLPPWVANLRFLVAYLAYSGFLNQVDLDVIRTHYQTMLADAPRVDPA